MNSGIDQANRGDVRARLANVPVNVNECFYRSMFRSNSLSGAPLRAVSVSTLLRKSYKVISTLHFRISEPIWNGPNGISFAALVIDALPRLA